jgi:hypothetical protein
MSQWKSNKYYILCVSVCVWASVHVACYIVICGLSASTGRFIMFSVITNSYNKKTKGRTLMELFTATGKLKKF